jgi:hypothetical protein
MDITGLRWLTVETHITADEVRAYARENQLTGLHAKEMLQNKVGPILQYSTYHPGIGHTWHSIEHVTEYRNPPSPIIDPGPAPTKEIQDARNDVLDGTL